MEFEVCEIFPSIQGEGVSTGVPTVFIRFFGCNLSCSWCDTDYSRTGDHHSSMDDRYLIDEVISHSISNVCLTGGEPLLQLGIIDLVEELIMRGLNVDVETNGSMPVSDMILKCPGVRLIMDVKTPSSGMAGSFLHENLGHLMYDDTLKFIIEGEGDLDFALAFIMEHRPCCNIIFTPCSNRGGEMVVEGLLRAVMSREAIDGDLHRHPLSRARVMLQTHRVIWGDKKGV